MLIGVSAIIFFAFFNDFFWLQKPREVQLDWVMQLSRDFQQTTRSERFVFLEIDEKTYRGWQEPLYTPRDYLLDLIKISVGGRPAVIVVDVDLSRSIHAPGTQLHPHDQALFDYFNAYSQKCDAEKASINQSGSAICPQIIFARASRNSLSNDKTREMVPAFLEPVVAASGDLHWGSSLFDKDGDDVIRRWRMWELACDSRGHPLIMPSIQLLASAFVIDGKQAQEKLRDYLQAITPADCEGKILKPQSPLEFGQYPHTITIETTESSVERRISFNFTWPWHNGEAWKSQDAGSLINAIANKQTIDTKHFADAVVVIGGSYQHSHDLHKTPLGNAPGALILLDATHALLNYGQLHTLDFWTNLSLQLFLVLVLSFLLAKYDGLAATLAITVVTYSILLPFVLYNFIALRIAIDVAAPLLAMQLCQFIVEVYALFRRNQEVPE